MSPGGLCGRDRLEEREEWGEAVGLGGRWRSEDDHRCFGAAPGVSDADGRRFCWQRRHGSRCLRLLGRTDEYDVVCRSRAQWGPGRSLRDQIFFLLRAAPRDHQPLTANCHQPPIATNHQPSTAANRHQPPITNCRLPPTAANRRQPPTANRQSPPAANRQSPPTMVEHLSYTRSFLKKPCTGTVFFLFFSVKDRLGGAVA